MKVELTKKEAQLMLSSIYISANTNRALRNKSEPGYKFSSLEADCIRKLKLVLGI